MGFQEVSEAFDKTAPSMDTVVLRNPINAWMRQVNFSVLRKSFPAGCTLLELGCGTGEEARRLAEKGCRILAIDVSEGMVARARNKAESSGLRDRIIIQQGRTADMEKIVQMSPWRTFDGAYASFSLTYEPGLREICTSLHRILKPGALFICTLPNKIVLSEALIYGFQLRFRQVTWRFARPLHREIEGHQLIIQAYRPQEVVRSFDGLFRLRSLIGVPVFLPPVYLHPFYRRLGRGQRLLQRLDSLLDSYYPWNHLGEHTLFIFQRLN